MTRLLPKLAALGGLTIASVAVGAAPVHADGAVTFQCSDVFPDQGIGGTIVITPNGQLRANCFQHTSDGTGGGSTGGGADFIDCTDVNVPGEGVVVITPSGNTLVNCHIHVG
jgi:hypothetical protein